MASANFFVDNRLAAATVTFLVSLLLSWPKSCSGQTGLVGNSAPSVYLCYNLNNTYVDFPNTKPELNHALNQSCTGTSSFFIQINEEIPSGVPLIQLTATDLENDPVTMTLTGKDLATYYFSLQSFPSNRTAILKSNSRIDVDTMKSFLVPLAIQLDDGSNQISAPFDVVVISDINDNPPEFQNLPYRWEIPENMGPASVAPYMITAIDRDFGATRVSIQFKDASGFFSYSDLNTTKYCSPSDPTLCNGRINYRTVNLVRALDFEQNRFYQISINATDESTGGVSTLTDLVINVLDQQDTPPIFQAVSYVKTVPENSPNGTFVMKVFAEDGDRQIPNPIVYRLDPANQFSKYFNLNNLTGDLTISAVNLDRESADIQAVFGTFDLPVTAIEVSAVPQPANISQTTTTVRIVVEDKNDFTPTFNFAVYNATVMENTLTDVPITLSSSLIAFDYDSGVFGEFNLTVMKDGTFYSNFDVSPSLVNREATLIIRVKNTTFLDYEVTKNVTFLIVARETRTVERLSSTATVRLDIQDMNDNRPVFSQASYSFAIPENSPMRTLVGNVTATDADSGIFGTVTYTLDGTDANKFLINSTTGAVFVNVDADKNQTLLDREKTQTVFLTVLASDGGGFVTSTLLQITLTDMNDQVPQFTRTQYSGYVKENNWAFETPLQVQAVDDDLKGSNNSLVMYRIAGGDPGGNFNLTIFTGILGIQSPLNYEALRSNLVNLTVMAYDAGVPSLNSTVVVMVTVLDQNDNSPVCTQAQFSVVVLENATYGTPVIQVNATDADAPGTDNSRVFFRIQSGAADKFAMNGDTGLISVERGADLDVNKYGDRYNITVVAYDMGAPQRSGACLVSISVRDVNNQKPYFDTPTRRESVKENQPINEPLQIFPQYYAKDPDTTAVLNYSILYDQMKAYEANGQPVNIEKYNYKDLFYILPFNGTLYVKNILDRERAQEIYIPIFVRDLAAETPLPIQTATATLILTLSDENDEWPVFTFPAINNTYRISVSEGLTPPTDISLTALAIDPDTYPPLFYSVQPPTAPFSVKSDTGQLSLIAPLDRETLDRITFFVLVNDSIHVTTATVYVNVTDVNDVVPTFYQFEPSINVSEGTPINSLLTTVLAYDNDTGLFGTVRYRILSGGDGKFSLNDTTGQLLLAQLLDREAAGGSTYSLLIEAYDNPGGTDSQRSSRSMAITVLDINDNPPRFAQANYTITSLLESMKTGQLIQEIPATDADAGINAQMNFTFVAIPGQDDLALSLFQVATKQSGMAFSAVISTRRDLTGSVGWYNVTLRATDFGSPSLVGATNITFFIADVNDHSPEFTFPTNGYVVKVNESTNSSSTIGNTLLQVRAIDRDFGNNSIIRFDLASSSGDDSAFAVDAISGLITISVNLDYETKTEYRFYVRARDLGTPPLTSSINLIVQVLDVDEGSAVFSPANRVQSMSVLENSAPAAPIPGVNLTGVYIGSVSKAVDPDTSVRSDTVCYFLLDKVFDTFYLNKSGDLYALKSFDRESVPRYTLRIVAVGSSECASDKYRWRGAPYVNSRRRRYLDDAPIAFDPSNPAMATIVVNVADTNDNPPVWTQPAYYGGVNVNDPPGTLVYSFADFASDADVGNNSVLTFGISGLMASTSQLAAQLQQRGILTDVFIIDNKTGVLKTGERTYFQDTMSGSVFFNVTTADAKFLATATCTIYLLSLDQQLVVTVGDVPGNVSRFRDAFINYLSNITGWRIVVDSIVTHKNDDGSADPTKSDLYIHAIDTRDNSIVPAITVQAKVDQFSSQMIVLYQRFGVLWVKLARQTSPSDATLEILKIALIAVAIGLTILLFFSCISLWSCRRMYRRKLKAATAVAFGPSGQHTSGNVMKTPGTNIHAFEGSNPIWMNGVDAMPYDNRAYESDKDSIDNNEVSNHLRSQEMQPAPSSSSYRQPQFDEVEKSMRFPHDAGSNGSAESLAGGGDSAAEDRKILDNVLDGRPESSVPSKLSNGNGTLPTTSMMGVPPASVLSQTSTRI